MTGGPVLRVVRGDATAEEVAALLVVLAAASRGRDTAAPSAARSAWADRRAGADRGWSRGPDAWRRSAWPH